MAQKVLILGDSGTGKSASMRNFTPDEVLVINSAGKPLPFRSHFETITPSFNTLTKDIMNALKIAGEIGNKKVIVIDDVQYILSFPMMRRIKESGWDKWNDIQGDFFNIIQDCDDLPDDVIVYFLSHLQRTDDGHEKIKTVGKMLDEKITIEGLFTVVLKTIVSDGKYYFQTQNSGMDTVKSPIGMFDTYAIDNDLKYVDTKIRNYYEIGEHASDEEIKELDQKAAKPEVKKPDGRKRRSKKTETIATTKGMVEVETPEVPIEAETPEAPKRRRRKVSDEKEESKQEEPEQAQVEDAKKESTAEKPKRRRRKQRTELTEEDMNFEPISDDDIPF
ncbi:AAA family ATPase [Anaerotignum sp.]